MAHMIHRLSQPPTDRPRSGVRWFLCALAGAGAGLLNGLLGAAGGILLVYVLPRLTPPTTLSPDGRPIGEICERRDILATALSVMLPVSAVSWFFYWLGGVRSTPSLLPALLLPAAAGGLLGALLLGRLPDRLLRRLFAALVVASGLRMLL